MNDKTYMEMLRDEEYSSEDRSPVSARGIAGCALELGYLLFLLIAGCLFLTKGNGSGVSFLFAGLSFMLCVTDAFYLIPAVRGTIEGRSDRINRLIIRGVYASCAAVTVSHILLLYIWRGLFPPLTPFPLCAVVLWGASIFRTGAYILSRGDNNERKYDRKWMLYRSVPLIVTGVFLIVMFLLPAGNTGSGYWKMSLTILISTGCSTALETWYGEVPGVGVLLIPRNISFAAMLVMGLFLYI